MKYFIAGAVFVLAVALCLACSYIGQPPLTRASLTFGDGPERPARYSLTPTPDKVAK